MKRTENLNLPIYDNPESDIFKVNDVNNAHEAIDKQYKELKNIKETVESTNPSANLQGQINDINASLDKKASNTALDVERKRINNLIALPDGSTTADAELVDLRVAVDGTKYDTAGESVRNQFLEINEITDKIIIPSVNLLNPRKYRLNGYYNSSGIFVSAQGNGQSGFIKCSKGEKFYFNTTNKPAIAFFNETETMVARISANGWSEYFIVPDNDEIRYVSVGFSMNDANFNQLMLTKDIKPTTYVSYDDFKLVESKKILDKNFMFFGDSITAKEERWVSTFVSLLGIKNYTNLAVSGAHWKDYSNTDYPYDGNPQPGTDTQKNNVLGNQVQKAINGNYPTPDVIMMFAGTNDNMNYEGADIETQFVVDGIYKDIETVDRKTFAGAMRWCVEKLYEKYPNAIIVIITPIQCAEDVRAYSMQKQKSDLIKKSAERMSCYVIDAFNKSGIYQKFESSGKNGRYLIDGLHPNTNGGVHLGTYNANEISNRFFIHN